MQCALFAPLGIAAARGLAGCGSESPRPASGGGGGPYGALQAADANGVRLPAGFESRLVARSGEEAVPGSGYAWHDAPDGGACFAAGDGGWIYVSNSEVSGGGGGAGALRFDAAGLPIASYRILDHTSRNCAGGATPWRTWLSCEETGTGRVWQCDPFGGALPRELPSLGVFRHEAVAVDSTSSILYMTEDEPDGRLYRFVPDGVDLDGNPSLDGGRLQAAEVASRAGGQALEWHDVPDPLAAVTPTRYQVAASSAFNRGEGIWYDDGVVYFATTGDDRVWSYDTASGQLNVVYDGRDFAAPVLRGVDNITVSPRKEILVAEDGDDMQIVAITPAGEVLPIAQVLGHGNSEIAGLAFDPSGQRLYFSSQRGPTGRSSDGITYEIGGPFQRQP